MSEPVTVFGFKETMTISEQHGAVLKATFTVVNPEQIFESTSGRHSEHDLNKVLSWKQEEGGYKLVCGREHLETALSQYIDNLAAGQSVTISFGLDVRAIKQKTQKTSVATPTRCTNKQLPQTAKGFNAVKSALKYLRNKAVIKRASFSG